LKSGQCTRCLQRSLESRPRRLCFYGRIRISKPPCYRSTARGRIARSGLGVPSSVTLDGEQDVGESRHRLGAIPVALQFANELNPGNRFRARLLEAP
jgi:hypothetical protein